MTRILVTGAGGFVGRNFVKHLLKETDYDVIALLGLTYADAPDLLESHPRLRRHFWDLRSPINDRLAGQIGQVDFVTNWAAASHVDDSINEPCGFVMNNVQVALTMLEFARRVKPKAFVQIGTDEIFGPNPPGYFFKEWDRLIPSNPYSASKACQLQLSTAWWRTYGVPVIHANPMNVFGENQHLQKFIPKTINLLLQGKAVPVHGERLADGNWRAGTRTWLHAMNVSSAIRFILENHTPARWPEADRPSAFNVSGTLELSNLEIVQRAAEILGVEPRYEWVDAHTQRPGHDRSYGLSGEKLASIGWSPPIPFDESFRDVVNSYKKEFSR